MSDTAYRITIRIVYTIDPKGGLLDAMDELKEILERGVVGGSDIWDIGLVKGEEEKP